MPLSSETIVIPSNQTIDFIHVDGGEFLMGDKDDGNAHRVKVSSFDIGKYPVTQGQWKAITGENASRFKGESRPVEMVFWNKVQDFILQLNKATGKQFRLPTEAEWEYAARGGKYSQGYTYSGSDKLKQVGWYTENSNDETHDVGLMLANELGIHDMSGNVYEWCADWYDEKYYEACKKKGVVENPPGSDRGAYRVVRGGGSFDNALYCRPSYRDRDRPDNHAYDIGFRLILLPPSVG